MLRLGSLAAAMLLGITGTAFAGPATPDQLGTYSGVVKSFYYEEATGKKVISPSQPCSIIITAADNNTVTLNQDNSFSVTATNCTFTAKQGSFHNTTPTNFMSTFKFSGTGTNVKIKGKYTAVNVYGISEATFSLKKVN